MNKNYFRGVPHRSSNIKGKGSTRSITFNNLNSKDPDTIHDYQEN